MAKWFVAFIVDGPKFEPVMEVLSQFKLNIEEMKPVAGTPKRIRAGDKPAWQAIAEIATRAPQPRGFFNEALAKSGFNVKAIASGIDQAVRNGSLKKSKVKGVCLFSKGGK